METTIVYWGYILGIFWDNEHHRTFSSVIYAATVRSTKSPRPSADRNPLSRLSGVQYAADRGPKERTLDFCMRAQHAAGTAGASILIPLTRYKP